MNVDTERVEITKEYLAELESAVDFLDCLEACGVNNWDGYGDALDMCEYM